MRAIPLLEPVRGVFRAVAMAMVPAAQDYGAGDWAELEAAVEDALARRPVTLQRELRTFLKLLNVLAVPLGGATMVRLGAARRERVLHWLERAPVALLRRGVWGLRTLIFLGHYTRPSVVRASGWRGDPRGWAARPHLVAGGAGGAGDPFPRPA